LKNIYLLILIVCVTLASFSFATTDWQRAILFLFPVIYALCYLLKSVVKILEAKFTESVDAFTESVAAFLVAALCLLITLKVSYTFYNPLQSIAVLVAVVLFFRKSTNRDKLGMTSRSLVALASLNGVLMLTPDKFLLPYIYLDDDSVAWTPKLNWNDFDVLDKGKRDEVPDSLVFDATIFSNYIYIKNKMFNYPPAIAVVFMVKSKSYRKHDVGDGDMQLLEHEQGHFNLTERSVRMATDSVSKLWGRDGAEIDAVFNYFSMERFKADSIYDAQTNHGLDTLQQAKWTKKLMLN
jgi:hypothetical protein